QRRARESRRVRARSGFLLSVSKESNSIETRCEFSKRGRAPGDFARRELFPEPLEAIRELRAALPLIREPGDEKRKGLRVSCDPKRSGAHRIEPDVADQLGGHSFGAQVVPAIYEARSSGFAPVLEHVKKHLARHGVERRHDSRSRKPLCQLLRAGG